MTLYTTPNCGPCKILKNLLKGSSVKEVDVTTEAGLKEANEHKVRTLPTLVVDGKQVTGILNIKKALTL